MTCPTCRTNRDGRREPCPECGAGAPDVPALEVDEGLQTTSSHEPGSNGLRVAIDPRLEYASMPAQGDPVVGLLVQIRPEGPPALAAGGPVAHVILLLDLSASMNHPDKYPMLTEALSGMLHDLKSPGARDVLLSIVLFAYGAEILLRDVPARGIDPKALLAKIDASKLRFGRYTDVAGGLDHACGIAADQLRTHKGMPTRIYVLTDGRPQDMPSARAAMARLSKLAVDVDGLAFGADADVGLLQELVSGGRGGTVKHIRPDTLSEAFDRIAEVAGRVVSNRALLDVELGHGVVGGPAFRYRPGRHRYPAPAFTDGTRFHTDLGTLESGRTYSLFFDVRLPESEPGATQIAKVLLRLPGPHGLRTFESSVSMKRTAGADLPAADHDVVAARDLLGALSAEDPAAQLRALRIRAKLYEAESRDPHVIGVIRKAIEALEREGSLTALNASERATLRSHTCTSGNGRTAPARGEFVTG